ncbi:O-antigen ligase family protein [Aneurinibacillus danicus]|uniref:O-antigen ligase family protein n=1 Tax=Aneurinibacillus danicus TaxID=267746 RepID=UPI0011BD8C49|nr:O-antigen ligase family protein [Aneurinibacillus danicus]
MIINIRRLQFFLACATVIFSIFGPFFSLPIPIPLLEPTFFRITYFSLIVVSLFAFFQQKERVLMFSSLFSIMITSFFLIWLLYGICSLLWGRDIGEGIQYLFLLTSMFVLIWTINRFFLSLKGLFLLVELFIGTFFIIIVLGIYEMITGVHYKRSSLNELEVDGYWGITSVFHNQNDFATYLILNLPLLFLYTFSYERKIGRKLFVMVVSLSGVFCLFYTASRANILAFIIFLLCSACYSVVRKPTLGKILIMFGLPLLLIANIDRLLILLSMVLPEGAYNKISSMILFFDPSQAVESDSSFGTRDELWNAGLDYLQNSFFLGIGAGQVEVYNAQNGFPVHNIHNWWLEVLVNFGLPIFLLYVSMYSYLIIKNVIISWRSEGIRSTVARANAFTLLIYIISAASTSSAIHFAMQWSIVALAILTIRIDKVEFANEHSRHIPYVSQD